MVHNNTLHILNGQEMDHYYKKIHFLEQEMTTPFNEAMCVGSTTDNIFSPHFIEIRSNVHHVTPHQYEKITLKPLQPLFSGNFSNIELWFDADMFCQMNLLTILAWLDQTDYHGSIVLHIVSDTFEPVEEYTLHARGYDAIYKQVLIDKLKPENISPAPLKKGVELYLNYLKKESSLMKYIQKHQHIPESDLVSTLIGKFKEYGLGDTQYLEIIRNNRSQV